MVEGDLVDLTLPTLLQALAKESATVTMRLQHGTDAGSLHFNEGSLIHATRGELVGDDAVLEILSWGEGRFRIQREPDRQPRTVTSRVTEFLRRGDRASSANGSAGGNGGGAFNTDEELLTALLSLLTRLEQDRVRLAEGRVESGVPALLVVTAIVNSLVSFVTARCSDPALLPSRLLPRLADTQPYTQLLGEDNERISIATAASVLNTWKTNATDRQQLFQDLCRALLDMLAIYCNTVNTFFHSPRDREEWRATFDVFVDGLWTAIQQLQA